MTKYNWLDHAKAASILALAYARGGNRIKAWAFISDARFFLSMAAKARGCRAVFESI